jgi:DNA-binding NtrC family response regulator
VAGKPSAVRTILSGFRMLQVDIGREGMVEIYVLIVDDDLDFAGTLSDRLAAKGLKAEYAGNGKDALATVITTRPDIVILDLKLSAPNGLDVLEAIKTFDPSMEVIIFASPGSTSSGIEGMERGAFDYFIKPIDLDLLLEKIYLAFEKKKYAVAVGAVQ